MKPVDRLVRRLRNITEVPEHFAFHRTRAGRCQREAGAWSWWIERPGTDGIAGRDLFASWTPVTELLRSPQLALVTGGRVDHVKYLVYDLRDVGDLSSFHNHDTLVEPRCSTCGSREGLWSDDTHWTCTGCGEEWPSGVWSVTA